MEWDKLKANRLAVGAKNVWAAKVAMDTLMVNDRYRVEKIVWSR